MLRSLAFGKFQPNIIINRQISLLRNNFYQTICIAKSSDGKSTFICTISNLKVFLETLEKNEKDFKIDFRYQIKPITSQTTASLINYIFLGIVVGLTFTVAKKLKNVNLFGNSDKILGTKKFEPIKPENIQTMFKDVAGMHEAKT